MLKANLHSHTTEDIEHPLKYNAKQLIDEAAKFGFNVLAITNHKSVFFNESLREYAKAKGILLILGVEAEIGGKEVLIYNITESELRQTKTFNDLKRLRKKRKDVLIIAPHPYFKKPDCLGKKLEPYKELFDAIEFSHFYIQKINWNKKAIEFAKKHNIPMVGTSDTHSLWQLNTTYSLIDAEPNIDSIFEAIKGNKIVIKTRPLLNREYFGFLLLDAPLMVVLGKLRQFWMAFQKKFG